MENNNNRSLFARISSVIGTVEDHQGNTLFDQWKSTTLAESLLVQYQQDLASYLQEIEIVQCPNALAYPLLFFYSQRSSRSIFTIIPFQYGEFRKSKELTRKTFPSFLVNYCNIRYVKGTKSTALYNALCRLIQDYPYNKLEMIINRLKDYNLQFALLLQTSLLFRFSSTGNLYFDTQILNPNQFDTEHRYQPIFKFVIPKDVPYVLVKSLFRELYAVHHKSGNSQGTLKEYATTQIENIFGNPGATHRSSVHYSFEVDQFIKTPLQSNKNYTAIKQVPVSRSNTISTVPEGVLHFLQSECGNNIGIVNQFSMFLSLSMSPSEGGATILCTQNPALLRNLLANVMGISPNIPTFGKRSLSFNMLSKSSWQQYLFVFQEQGLGIAFIADTIPSDPNLSTIKKLLKGKQIRLKTPIFPTQHYQNKIHFVCITSDPKKAFTLKDRLKADLIDFSATEVPSNENMAHFTEQDFHWFRTSFLLHGLKLRTIRATGIDITPQDTAPERPDIEENIGNFLAECCQYDAGAFCNTEDVYDSYSYYISATQNGRSAPMQKRTFNKRLRELLKQNQRLKSVEYVRSRYSSNGASETKRGYKALWGYKGLKLNLARSAPLPPQDQQLENKDILRQYLIEISRTNLHFDGIIQATLTFP